MLALSAYARVLADWSASDHLVIGTPIAGRNAVRAEAVVGFFVRTVPVAMRIDPSLGTSDLVEVVRDQFLAAFEHASVPYGEILQKLNLASRAGEDPLIRFWFNDISTEPARGNSGGIWRGNDPSNWITACMTLASTS